ncbi:5'-3'-deoxyribonucleotidase [Flavobacterium ginsengisoli]|uniref:5'-3'-deoxyribonucleotidase n=1 Tax=Flavobacterium ginsengisoli TaxID=871694 RepID=A0ABP7FX74_9FLAO|nr:5'(3')-deoxyribonucleotidase [Flavobacterium ginsengisoli]
MKKKSIAVDMDGVLADVEAHLITYFERDFGITILREEIQGLTEEEAFYGREKVRSVLNSKDFFRTLPVIDDAVESLKLLQENFEIYIVSAATEFPLSLNEKIEWLAEHFPFIQWQNIVLCGSKTIINTDYLIDDHPKNLDFCMGKPIMFTAFHNAKKENYLRVNNWKEAVAVLKEAV